MIAFGIVLLFVSYVVDYLWDVNNFAENYRTAYGWTTLLGLVLVVTGVVILAWRYLP